MSIVLATLIEILKEDNDVLTQILSSFFCNKDADIEYFLKNRAVEFERLSKSRTYLICDEEQISASEFCLDQLVIYGYISLALKVLSVPDGTSTSTRKKLDGLSGKMHGTPINHFPCYLIGQLSKNSGIDNNILTGKDLLQFAYDNIVTSVEAVGGRYMMIECKNQKKLIEFYKNNGFQEITQIPDNGQPMVQMIRKI